MKELCEFIRYEPNNQFLNMTTQVFCIDASNLYHLDSYQKPEEGKLYDVLRETKDGYLLVGLGEEKEFVGSEYRYLIFLKERFIVFNGGYDSHEFNDHSKSYSDWVDYFKIAGVNDGSINDMNASDFNKRYGNDSDISNSFFDEDF